MCLRAMINADTGAVVVAQRLKRMNRILGKLEPMPGTKVARTHLQRDDQHSTAAPLVVVAYDACVIGR
jgi:hypothetical protein